MYMKKILIVALAIISTACASSHKDPVEAAIEARIAENMGAPAIKMTYYQHPVKIDSTTLGTEIDRRRKLFEKKIEVESVQLIRLLGEGRRKNAEIRQESIRKSYEFIEKIDSLKMSLNARLDDVAYYDYSFSGLAKADGQKDNEMKNAFFSITPSMIVLALTNDKSDLHKAGGWAIPGYYEILNGLDLKEEDE